MKLTDGQYYGDISQTKNLSEILLTVSNYTSGSSIPSHYHSNPYFCYILDGTYSEYSSKKHIICKKGDVIYHPCQSEHRNHFEAGGARCFNIEYTGRLASELHSHGKNIGNMENSSEIIVESTAMKLFREFQQPDDLSGLMIESLAIELSILFFREKKRKNYIPFFLKKVRKYVDTNIYHSLSLNELSKVAGVSPEHLIREFKKHHGITIGEYMRGKKIRTASDMLKHSKKDISEIAFELGYADSSHFTRVFKKVTGFTPSFYRAQV